jgi:hypothetical protein
MIYKKKHATPRYLGKPNEGVNKSAYVTVEPRIVPVAAICPKSLM